MKFEHYLSAWLYCFKNKISFTPVKTGLREWEVVHD